MKPSVYLETTIPSYLTAWRSPELVMAANQEATRSWWDTARPKFEVFVSVLVLAAMRLKIESICKSSGYEPPIICTPLELMED